VEEVVPVDEVTPHRVITIPLHHTACEGQTPRVITIRLPGAEGPLPVRLARIVSLRLQRSQVLLLQNGKCGFTCPDQFLISILCN